MRRATYKTLLTSYFLPQWPAAGSLLVLLLAGAAAAITRPALIAGFIDAARAGSATADLARGAALFVGMVVASQAIGIAEAYLAERIAIIATNELRADLTEHCLRLDMSFHNERRPGELIQRIDGDVASLGNLFSRFLVALAANAVLVAGVLVALATVDARLGGGLALFCVAVLVLLYRLRFAARPRWEKSMEAQAAQSGLLEEQLAATEDLRSSGATAFAMRRFFEHAADFLRSRRAASIVDGGVGAASNALFAVGSGSALAFAVWLFVRGKASIGTVYLVFAYAQMLSKPIQAINRQIQDLQSAAAAVRRVDELLAVESSLREGEGSPPAQGPLELELRDVDFAYLDGEPVLAGLSVRIEPGHVVGLLGRTGSGKTTIGRLALRFHDPQSGSVSVGGRDVRDYSLAGLRSRVGLVTQDVQLFHASVRDNVTLFDRAVEDETILQVFDDLGLAPWLGGLPGGLDTVLTSAGAGLSAGEAQLLAFARVFLLDPGLVVLDEATSRLDPVSEARIEHALDRLFEGRTVVVIAHRLRTALRADDILILEDGAVTERGPRAALEADPASRFSRLLRSGAEAEELLR